MAQQQPQRQRQQCDWPGGGKPVAAETRGELVTHLKGAGYPWRLSVEFLSGATLKAISTEVNAKNAARVLGAKAGTKERGGAGADAAADKAQIDGGWEKQCNFDGEQSIAAETCRAMVGALEGCGYKWRIAVEYRPTTQLKVVGTEERAQDVIRVLRKRAGVIDAAKATPLGVPFCVHCKEEFPIAEDPDDRHGPWRMAVLKKLKFAPKRIRRELSEWGAESELHGASWLCGNCYFDFES